MADTPSHAHPRAFVNADPDHAVAAMSDVIVELRPHVVVTYDPHGGYGHPDHIQAHRFTTEAIERAARTGWDTPKFYWIADTTTADQITTTVDITSVLDAKRAALRAHATQVTVAPDGMTFALSNNIPHPIHPYESFILVRGARGPVSVDGGEDDLFGGVA